MAAKFLGEAPVEAARAWVAHISEVGVRDATPGLPWPRSIGKPAGAWEDGPTITEARRGTGTASSRSQGARDEPGTGRYAACVYCVRAE